MPRDRRDLISDLYYGALARAPEERARFPDRGVQRETTGCGRKWSRCSNSSPPSARFLERSAAARGRGRGQCDLDD